MKSDPYVITGGGSGIGQALAWRLASQNEQVIIIGRRESALKETRARFPENIMAISADISTESGREKVVMALESTIVIKALIHGAGMVQPIASLRNVSLKEWQTIQAINVEAPLFLTQKLLPKLKNARILIISSQVAHAAQPCLAPYCVSKAGVFMLYQCFNLDFQSLNIHTACMTPGIVDTSMFLEIATNTSFPEAHRHFYQQVIEKNQWIKPDVAACFIEWLLCEIELQKFSEKEWDIYDESHHPFWVKGFSAPKTPGFA